jgi:hypothetical protein
MTWWRKRRKPVRSYSKSKRDRSLPLTEEEIQNGQTEDGNNRNPRGHPGVPDDLQPAT